MESYDAMKRVIAGDSAAIAKALHLHASTVARWSLPTDDYSQSGAFNPLDRLESAITEALRRGRSAADAYSPIQYLSLSVGGLFLPPAPKVTKHHAFAKQIATSMKEIGEALSKAADIIDDDDVSPNEKKEFFKEGYEALNELGELLRMAEDF